VRGIKLVLALFMVLVVVGCTTKGSQPESNNTVAHEAYSRLGFQYLQNGDTVTAKQSFQRAIELNGGYAEAYNGLALTFQLEGDSELAETYFRKAIAVAPDSAMVHNNFGAFLFSNERYAEACEELARATEDPFYNLRSQAFENLGRCYRLLDRKEASVHAFKRDYFDRFLTLVENRRVDHYAKSLWVGIRLARHNREATRAATFALILKNLYPNSEEYRQYEESAR